MKNIKSKISLFLFLLFTFCVLSSHNLILNNNSNYVLAKAREEIEVFPGGNCLGIKISTKGLLVVGFSDIELSTKKVESSSKKAGMKIGDVILSINEKKIGSTKDLVEYLSQEKENIANIKIERNNQILNLPVELVRENSNDNGKIGLWVRDSTAGIGTLTFYHEKTRKFAALGHPITDIDTNSIIKIKDGNVVDSCVINVKKGEKGNPGELKSIFVNEEKSIGFLKNNTQTGIYGESNGDIKNKCQNKAFKVGFKEEVKEGKAQIISNVEQGKSKYYDIEIIKVVSQDKPSPKSMIIKIVDEELLSKTGGIVQGMSGSPIIQNGKIIGAVTHVLVNKPDVGYGIYLEWMLKDAGIIK